VLVFEDLHWADRAMLAFLEHLPIGRRAYRCFCFALPARSCTRVRELGGGTAQRDDDQPRALSQDETALLIARSLERAVLPRGDPTALLERAAW
jgi:predicted ATPase